MDYRERAQAELARMAAEEAAKKQAIREQEQRESEVKARRIAQAVELIAELDSLEIAKALKEINRDIWDTKGQITFTDVNYFDSKEVIGRRISLQANVPQRVRKRIEPVEISVYGEYDTGRESQYGNWVSFIQKGWHAVYIADRIIEPEVDYVNNIFSVEYAFYKDRDSGVIFVYDSNLSIPAFKPESARDVVGKPPRESGTQAFTEKGRVGLRFETGSFDLEMARALVDHGLLASAVARTQNPIEPYFQKAEEDLTRIRPHVGRIINERTDFVDPTPIWRKIFK